MTRKRQNPDKILTNAERCKRYREVTFEKHKKNDALNEKYKRAMLEAKTPAENAERLKQCVFKKKFYRQHKKEMASVDLSHTLEEQLLENQQINQSTPISNKDPSTFKNKSTKSRCIKKASNALPKSPNKRKEVVEKLATCILKVKLPAISNKKGERPSKGSTEEELQWLTEF